MKLVDRTGERYGRLLVVKKVPRTTDTTEAHWLCRCDCGKEIIVTSGNLRSGNSTSCKNCAFRQYKIKHGRSHTRTHNIWVGIRQRCYNSKNPTYFYYGARGIRLCQRWNNFENFLKDMGECPYGYSIERLDNDGDYEPGNCIWIPRSHQQRNKSTTKVSVDKVKSIRQLFFAGYSRKQLARKFNVSRDIISSIVTWGTWKDVKCDFYLRQIGKLNGQI